MSPLPDPEAQAVEALTLEWKGMLTYAYPTAPLIRRVLNKIQDSEKLVYLVAHCYPQQPWFPSLLNLLIDQPRSIPQSWLPHLLRQPFNGAYHRQPERLNLHVWPLSRNPSKRKDFLDKCPRQWHTQSENQPWKSMRTSGSSGPIGIVRGKEIHAIPLYHR